MKKPGKAAPMFPPGLQFMQPPRDEIPKQRSLKAVKMRLRFRSILRILRANLLSPFFSARAAFGYLFAILGALLTLVFLNDEAWNNRSSTVVLGAAAFILATVFWAAACIVFSPFKARAEEQKLGKWQGPRFVFTQPQHVYTTGWKPENNGKCPLFLAKGFYPDVLVEYKIEVDGPTQRLNCCVLGAYYFNPVDDLLKHAQFDLRGRVRVRKDGRLALACYSKPQTIPAIIRVFLLAWEVEPDISMDYTDLRSGTRFEIRPPDKETISGLMQ